MSNRLMYLDYLNNFLTVDVFAEHHNITRVQAMAAIKAGRKEHDLMVSKRTPVATVSYDKFVKLACLGLVTALLLSHIADLVLDYCDL